MKFSFSISYSSIFFSFKLLCNFLKSTNLQNSESSPKIKKYFKNFKLSEIVTFFSVIKKKNTTKYFLCYVHYIMYNCIYNLIKNDDLEIFKTSLSSKYHDLSP